MRNPNIALAIGGILAATAAGATNHDIYVTGASAQRTFWTKDLVNICGAGSVVTEFDGNLLNSPQPDFKAWQCTGNASALAPVASGDLVTLHYSAELGSVWGVLPGLYYTSGGAVGVASHLFLEPNTTACAVKTASQTSSASGTASFSVTTSVWNCPATAAQTYDYNTDTLSPASTLFDQQKPDLVATDVEPEKWQYTGNWPAFTIFGTQATQANQTTLSTMRAAGRLLTGQVFSLITHGVPGNPTNLSTESASSIFQGKYKTWNQVPEVGALDTAVGGTQIRVCRRDAGSGTQVSASVTFVGTECGTPKTRAFVTNTGPGSGSLGAANVIINNTGSQMTTCVSGTGANIGYVNVSPSASYTTMSLDGIEANAHNAAAGYYPFAYETWIADLTAIGTSGASVGAGHVVDSALAFTFVDRVDTNNTLATVLGSESVLKLANSQYSTSAVTTSPTGPKGYYSLASTGNTPSVANLENGATTTVVGSGIPVAMYTNGGQSCSNLGNSNAN